MKTQRCKPLRCTVVPAWGGATGKHTARWPGWLWLLTCLLAACSATPGVVPAPPTPTPLAITPLAEVLRNGAGQPLATVAYLYKDDDGARLLDALGFSAGDTPQPLADPDTQIWLDVTAIAGLQTALRPAGTAQITTVIARGTLAGPGAFGPRGRYGYQLDAPRLQPLPALETTIAALLADRRSYQHRLVRLNAALLVNAEGLQGTGLSGLLIDRLGARGAPEQGAQQIKLYLPQPDAALLKRLQVAPGGSARFGAVQVEGIWSEGVFRALAVVPLVGR